MRHDLARAKRIPSEKGNLITLVIGCAESSESVFFYLQDKALLLPGAKFNFVFDYHANHDAVTLHSGCTFHKGSWFPSRAMTIPESED